MLPFAALGTWTQKISTGPRLVSAAARSAVSGHGTETGRATSRSGVRDASITPVVRRGEVGPSRCAASSDERTCSRPISPNARRHSGSVCRVTSCSATTPGARPANAVACSTSADLRRATFHVTTRRRRVRTPAAAFTAPRAELPASDRRTSANHSPPGGGARRCPCRCSGTTGRSQASARLLGPPRLIGSWRPLDAPVVPAGVVTPGAAQITTRSPARCSPVSGCGTDAARRLTCSSRNSGPGGAVRGQALRTSRAEPRPGASQAGRHR